MEIKLGLDTFGDIPMNNEGVLLSQEDAIRQVYKEGVMADDLGIDFFGVGEHHREDYAISSPTTILAALAGGTKRINLRSAVVVLSSDDPVRVYQQFVTINSISNGRIEAMIGRGSYTESFPLFGYDLKDYDALFNEKFDLFLSLVHQKEINWTGNHVQSVDTKKVFPKTLEKLKVGLAVGGSPDSVIRAGSNNLPVTFAIIGGDPARFKPLISLYKASKGGEITNEVGIHSPGVIAETDDEAIEIAWKYVKKQFDKIGTTRGWSPMSKERFIHEIEYGSLYVGSPETVSKKIIKTMKSLDIRTFSLIYGLGKQNVSSRESMLKLYAEQVIPNVKKSLEFESENDQN